MKKRPYLRIILYIAFLVAMYLILTWLGKGAKIPFSLYHNKAIDKTPAHIIHMEKIGEWEFLSIRDEELVDTVKKHFFRPGDQLARIYSGTLRLGINFDQCDSLWATYLGDSAILSLPAIDLLDQNFIDEARSRSFFERGEWSAEEREEMYQRAQTRMKARCLTPENKKRAEENARTQLEALFRTMGYRVVEITIAPSSSQP